MLISSLGQISSFLHINISVSTGKYTFTINKIKCNESFHIQTSIELEYLCIS